MVDNLMEKTPDQEVAMPEQKTAEVEGDTKRKFRRKVWVNMIKKEAVSLSSNYAHNRIPNFINAAEAAKRLSELEEFKQAKVIKISPDKPQESVKNIALENGKEILVPKPRLKSGLFNLISRVANPTEEELKNVVTKHGIQQLEKPVGLDANLKVDLVVLGSVCVSSSGYRIGEGEGYADLEFAIMTKMGAVNGDTIVATTVHDYQILDDLPSTLFKTHDVPVDIIVTPTKTILVNPKLRKPDSILWNLLSIRRVKSMPILQELKVMDEKEGKEIILKEDDSEEEAIFLERSKLKRVIGRIRLKIKRNLNSTVESGEGDKESGKPRVTKRRLRQKRGGDGDNNVSSETEKTEKTIGKEPRRRPPFRSRQRYQIDFSLKLSNISSDVRVRDLKNALIDRGVRPSEITWRGQRGFCFLHFGKLRNGKTTTEPVQVDSIVANLQELKLGQEEVSSEKPFIIVEPAKPITRIEVTDVTTV